MPTLKHRFVSAKADGGDSTLVKPTDWNDEHDLLSDGDGVILGVPAGAGPGEFQEIPMSNVFPAGIVLPSAAVTIPAGWLLCDGRLLNRADQPALFTALGTAFNVGGEATTQFRIPDCRGRVIAGIDAGTGRLNIYIGNAMGAAGGQQQEQANIFGTVDVGVSVNGTLNGATGGPTPPFQTIVDGSGTGVATSGHSHSASVSGTLNGAGAGNIRNDGNNLTSAVSNVQPTIQMNLIIKT